MRIENGKLVLTIKDDGRGFADGVNSHGLGLNGMRERARMIGANLTIESRPGEGTKVRLALNLDRPAKASLARLYPILILTMQIKAY